MASNARPGILFASLIVSDLLLGVALVRPAAAATRSCDNSACVLDHCDPINGYLCTIVHQGCSGTKCQKT